MNCPYCKYKETRVIDSREVDGGRAVRRRRECEKCAKRFSTYERVEFSDLVVKKRDGKKEEYDKEKMANSIRVATNKRLNDDEVQELITFLENKIRIKYKKQVSTKEIGEIILEALEKKDEVAYLRYASVFKSFGSGKRFISEADKIK